MKKLRIKRAKISNLSQVKEGAAHGSRYAIFQNKQEGTTMQPLGEGAVNDELVEMRANMLGSDVLAAFQEAVSEAETAQDVQDAITELPDLLRQELLGTVSQPDGDEPVGLNQGKEKHEMKVTVQGAPQEEAESASTGLFQNLSGLFANVARVKDGLGQVDSTANVQAEAQVENPTTPVTPTATPVTPAAPAAQEAKTEVPAQPAAVEAPATPVTPTAPVAPVAPVAPAPAISQEEALKPLLDAIKGVIAPVAQNVAEMRQELDELKKVRPVSRQPDGELAQQPAKERVPFSGIPFPPAP